MRKLIEECLKGSIQASESSNEDILWAMDFDLGIIDGDAELESKSDVRSDVFLDRVIASCDDASLLQVRDFFITDF
jgi:hypothetical protein